MLLLTPNGNPKVQPNLYHRTLHPAMLCAFPINVQTTAQKPGKHVQTAAHQQSPGLHLTGTSPRQICVFYGVTHQLLVGGVGVVSREGDVDG